VAQPLLVEALDLGDLGEERLLERGRLEPVDPARLVREQRSPHRVERRDARLARGRRAAAVERDALFERGVGEVVRRPFGHDVGIEPLVELHHARPGLPADHQQPTVSPLLSRNGDLQQVAPPEF
jgi:hypothetical protein